MADPALTDGPKTAALTTALPSTGVTAVTSLACTGGSATTIPIASGAELVLYNPTTGIRQSGIYTSAAVAVGATSIPTAAFIAAQGLGTGTEVHLPGTAGAVFTVLRAQLAALAAGTDGTTELGTVPAGIPATAYISRVTLVSPSTLALDATNTTTFTVTTYKAGTTNGTVATQSNAAAAWTADTPRNAAVTQPTAAMAAGDSFNVAKTHAASGTASLAGFVVEVEISY
jgi:hypothetical protein